MPDPLIHVKKAFFDRKAVIMKMSAAKRKALSKIGAYVRQRAKTSMRKKKGASAPGTPPHAHVGLLRKLLFFEYDFIRDSVRIGPAPIRKFTGVPRLLEMGGVRQLKTRAGWPYSARYRPRPYMRPALAAEIAAGTVGKAFRGSFV